jgi:hypothetical protein
MRPNRHGIDRTQFDAERELDEVIGRYQPNAGERRLVRYGKWLARALVALGLAVAAAAVIAFTLDRHMRNAETAPAPKRPVVVDILPAGR